MMNITQKLMCLHDWGVCTVPSDVWERLQAPSDLVSVRRRAARRAFLQLAQTGVGAGVSAAGMCILAVRLLGPGEDTHTHTHTYSVSHTEYLWFLYTHTR